MGAPLLTVYITNYNYGRYIKQAVESVLNQSFQDFELLIIDDGSTDDSRTIIESYANHPQIKIIYQQNQGLNITNNIALRLAVGKYIMRLDADDYLAPEALESMIQVLEADSTLGLVFPDYYLVDQNNNITAEIRRHDFGEEVTLLDQPAHGACTMIRVENLKAVGGYDEQYSCQDGYELWIKFIANFKVNNIRKALFYYRQHGENLTSNENRILDTRRSIKDNFISKNAIPLSDTLAIVPVRNTKLRGSALAFTEIGGKTILDIKLEALLESKLLKKIVVTSSEALVKQHLQDHYADEHRVLFIDRPDEFARFNVSLNDTIHHILGHASLAYMRRHAFMILPIEYPFLNGAVVDDAINTMAIFKADAVISVRIERSTFYQHDGSGMTPILSQDQFTKLEREALYKGVGGITLNKVDSFVASNRILSGKVSHIVVDQKTAHGIFSGFDLEVAQLLAQKATSPIR
ncbi:MAG: glycosyltransferase family 2 protein [Bacteroidota bacterium]